MRFSRTIFTFFISAAMLAASAFAAAPMAKTQAPGFYRTMVGDFEITALSDGTVGLPADQLLIGINKNDLNKALAYHHQSLPVETSVNGYLVNTGSKLVLIDAGAGVLFGPTAGKLINSLKVAGYQPEQVDEIYITHMHGDHIGGMTSNGQRVFPNAIVRAEQHDADFWLSVEQMNKAPPEFKQFFEAAQATFKPYSDAGKFSPFKGDTQLIPGIRAVLTQAHTPGHSVYYVESKGKRMVVLGDLIHIGAVQFDKPKVAITFDSDSKNAIKERIKTFDKVAKDGDLAAGAHLSFPGLGYIQKTGKGYDWVPATYQSAP